MVPLPVLLVASPSEKSDLFQPEAVPHEYSEDSHPTTKQEHKSITDLPWILTRMLRTRFIHKFAIYPSKASTKPGRQSPEIKGQSTEYQGDVFKVVHLRSTNPAIFKEAMEKVRCWLY